MRTITCAQCGTEKKTYRKNASFCSPTCSRVAGRGTFKKTDPIGRFWTKAIIKDDPAACWEWQANKNHRGYGLFASWDENRKTHHVAAHRYAWELVNGPVKDGLFVLHRCDNRGCVRPSHLFLGTQQDNVDDMVAKGRGIRGERHHKAKVSDAQAEAIRSLRGIVPQSTVGKTYGLTQTAVSYIMRGLRKSAQGG
jgi:hypothetical protein